MRALMMVVVALVLGVPGVARAQVSDANAAAAPCPEAKKLTALQAKFDDFAQLARYHEDDLKLEPHVAGRVVFYGDSITDNWGRKYGAFFPGKPYVNRGISGQTTPQMLIRLRQDVIDLHPEAVVILAGTNDIAGNTGPSTLGMIEDNLRSMVELAQANHIRPIVSSVTPAADYPWKRGMDPAPKIKTLNAWIADYCREKHITYLDYYSAMAGPDGGMRPGISVDGVHPNDAGYAIMGPLAEAAIEEK